MAEKSRRALPKTTSFSEYSREEGIFTKTLSRIIIFGTMPKQLEGYKLDRTQAGLVNIKEVS